MSINGLTEQYIPLSINGLSNINTNSIIINGVPFDPTLLVPYTGATTNVNLGSNTLTTTGNVSADTIYTYNGIKTISNPMKFYVDTGYNFNYYTNNIPTAVINASNIISYGIFRSMDFSNSNNWTIGLNKTTLDFEFKYNNTKVANFDQYGNLFLTTPSVYLINYIQYISSTQLLVRLSVPDVFSVGDVLNIEDNFYRGQVVYQSSLGPGTDAFYVSNGQGYGNSGNKFGGSVSLNIGIINSNITRNKQNVIDNLYTFKKDSSNSNLQLLYVNDLLYYWTNGGRFKAIELECKTNYCVNAEITGNVNYIYGGNTWSQYQTSGNNFNLDFNSVNKVFVDTAGKLGATSLAFTSNLLTNTVTLSSAEVSTLTGINTGTTIQAQINALSGSGFITKTGTTTGCSPTLQLNTNTSTFLINGYLGVLYPFFCVNFANSGDTFIKNVHSTSQINSKSASYYDISSSITGLLDAKISTNGTTTIQTPILKLQGSTNYIQWQDETGVEMVVFGKAFQQFRGEVYFISNATAGLRISYGVSGKGVMFRNDTSDFYILISDTYNSSFNSLRPFFITLSSGLLNSQNGQNFSGGLTSTGNIICSKSNASVRVQSGSYGCDFATNTTAGFYLTDASVGDTCIVSNLSPIRLSGGSSLTTDLYVDNTLVTIKNRLDCPVVNCSNVFWMGVPNSIWMTDLRSNLNTPSTTFGRFFGTGGVIYQDFYNQFQWRSSPTLNSGNIHTSMTLTNRGTTKGDLNVNGNITCDAIKVLSGTISTQINPYLLSRTEASNFMEYGETMSCVIFDRVAWTTGSTYISWFRKFTDNSTLSFVGNVTAYSSSAGQNIYWRITFDNLTDGSSYVHEYSFYFNQAFVHTTLPCVGVVSSSGNSGFGTFATAGVYTVTFVRLNAYMASDAGDSINIHFLITPNFRGK